MDGILDLFEESLTERFQVLAIIVYCIERRWAVRSRSPSSGAIIDTMSARL